MSFNTLNKETFNAQDATRNEHDDTANVTLKRVGSYGWNSDDLRWVRQSVDESGNSIVQISDTSSLNTLIATLQELVGRLAPLAGAMSPTAQLRVLQTAVPSTAVTGPITSAQSISEKAVAGVLYPEKIAATNLTAVISNINNVKIS